MNASIKNLYEERTPVGSSPIFPKTIQDLRKSYGTNWTKANVSVLFEWITIAAYNIRCLDMSTDYYRKRIRINVIVGLVLSTLSGTAAALQAAFPDTMSIHVTIGLNVTFVVLTFTIAIMTGYIKIYQIQENLESSIKSQQDWIIFSTELASELQLPTELRRDALWMIIKNKNSYLDLLKTKLEIPDAIAKTAKKEFEQETQLTMDVGSLPHIMIDIILQEMRDIGAENKEDRLTSVVQKQLKHFKSIVPQQSLPLPLPKKVSFSKRSLKPTEQSLSTLTPRQPLAPPPSPASLDDENTPGTVHDEHQVVTLDMGRV
jgi:hypothetical protein